VGFFPAGLVFFFLGVAVEEWVVVWATANGTDTVWAHKNDQARMAITFPR
jgi:hypothetical protein